MAKKRTNVIPIIGDARKPLEYRFLVGMVDVVFADVGILKNLKHLLTPYNQRERERFVNF